VTPDQPIAPPDASGNGQPKTPRWAAPGPKPPAPAPPPEEQHQVAERRLRDEMARHRRAERQQMAALKWGCISVLAAIVVFLVIGFIFF
jgi:hypothetical protein